MKKLKVTAELGFEDIGKNSNMESVRLDLRKGMKELLFEIGTEYENVISFNILEIVLDSDGVDNRK